MAALTADVSPSMASMWNPHSIEAEAGVIDTYYDGGVSYVLAAGRITPVNTAAGLQPLGLNQGQVTTTATSGQTVKVACTGLWLINYATPALTDEGVLLSADASALSDNPADLDTGLTSTGDTAFAFVVKLDTTSTGCWCDIARKAIAVVS